jgi:hypothetical protein
MDASRYKHPHIILHDTASTEKFSSVKTPRVIFKFPERDRQQHAQHLLSQLKTVGADLKRLVEAQTAAGIAGEHGITLRFESDPHFKLKFDSLDLQGCGIELLSVNQIADKTIACVYIPDSKLKSFITKIEKYQKEDSKFKKPKNQKLAASISNIRKATIKSLWTDDPAYFPAEGKEIWWEIWLRGGADRKTSLEIFRSFAPEVGLKLKSEEIHFPDRTVILGFGNRDQMAKSLDLLNCIAELRKAKDTAKFFSSMPRKEQVEWLEDALEKIIPAPNDFLAVCILDTGVTKSHPLIDRHLDIVDMHSYNPAWRVHDNEGHGTEMAGLVLFGDLVQIMASPVPITVPFKLESVKILPPRPAANDPDLYGKITEECASRPIITAPRRQRIYSMAVTTTDFRDRGQPSSWSSSIDKLCSGMEDQIQKLFIISAGNSDPKKIYLYPDSNMTDGIHDPGQAWNAVCIGAHTEKLEFDQKEYPGWQPVAPPGGLCPSSTTSLVWERQWPIKPDVVFEGGNWVKNADNGVDTPDDMQLLTTYYKPQEKPFTTCGDTSAATAQIAGMAGSIQAAYPELWPETIRALVVHSAEWTQAMLSRIYPSNSRQDWANILKCYGYGVPNLQRAMRSAENALTLVVQDELYPFELKGSYCTTRDMHLHKIPWPVEVLRDLGSAEAEMRVTLSYFIEPNPARRGWGNRYRYASHGLRFDVKTAEENLTQFRRKINRIAREEEEGIPKSESGSKDWVLGPQNRDKGSLHSDIWKGSAIDLSQRGYIAVYPVTGWWKERPKLDKWNSKARYSLLVSISTPQNEVPIYTSIVNKIGIQIST